MKGKKKQAEADPAGYKVSYNHIDIKCYTVSRTLSILEQ